MAIPLLAPIDIAGKTITADALLTQRKLARHLVARGAHSVFIAKDNQPHLAEDIRRHFAARAEPDFRAAPDLQHGRVETRAIWTSTALNDYLDFPHVGQVFAIERHTIEKTTGKSSTETVYGVTDHTPHSANPARLLAYNRDHWRVEAHRLRTGHGPANITRLRRFAIGLIKARSRDSVAATIDKLARKTRRVFDYLGISANCAPRIARPAPMG